MGINNTGYAYSLAHLDYFHSGYDLDVDGQIILSNTIGCR